VAQAGSEIPEPKMTSQETRSTMIRVQVQSSNIRAVGHDPQTLTLEIEFQNGNVYQYFDVPRAIHEELMKAPSHGEFVNRHIKGSYRYAKV
jgi:KTSC domain